MARKVVLDDVMGALGLYIDRGDPMHGISCPRRYREAGCNCGLMALIEASRSWRVRNHVRARNVDPMTSKLAARAIEGRLAGKWARIIDVMAGGRFGGWTASEIGRIIPGAWRRMCELERAGLIVRTGAMRIDRETGCVQAVYDLPRKEEG